MNAILSNYTASISELKKSPSELLKNAGSEAIAILNHNVTSAYLVPAKTYEKLIDMLDDYFLSKDVENRLNDNAKSIEISLDEL
jgi:antitoxin StbD